jgi:hypothetical protein
LKGDIVKELKLIKPLCWLEVMEIWKNNEEHLEHWKEYAKARGYSSWEDWRQRFFDMFGCPQLEWGLYEIEMPRLNIAYFRGGPFKNWYRLFYNGMEMPRFWEMAENRAMCNDERFKPFIDNFPSETIFIGLESREDVFVIEGMHRCAAVAIAAVNKDDLVIESARIALAKFPYWKLYLLSKKAKFLAHLKAA